jgi:hypothetical protein
MATIDQRVNTARGAQATGQLYVCVVTHVYVGGRAATLGEYDTGAFRLQVSFFSVANCPL